MKKKNKIKINENKINFIKLLFLFIYLLFFLSYVGCRKYEKDKKKNKNKCQVNVWNISLFIYHYSKYYLF